MSEGVAWQPNLGTRTLVGGLVDALVDRLPPLLGIDQIISGCEVTDMDPYAVGLGVLPRYIRVALRGHYHVDVTYRGNIELNVADLCIIVRLQDGDLYEVLGPGGSTGAWVLPIHTHADATEGGATISATLYDTAATVSGVFTHSANVVMYDGVGDSPEVQWIPQGGDVWAIFAEDAVPGNSDLVFQMPAADADARVIFRSSTPADVAYIDAAGNAYFRGHMAVGGAAVVNASYFIYATEVVDATAVTIGMYSVVDVAPGANFATEHYGVVGAVHLSTAFNCTGELIGMVAIATIDNGLAVAVDDLWGMVLAVDAEDAAVVNAGGFSIYTPRLDTGTLQAGYGVRISQGTVGIGIVATLYGVYVAPIIAGVTNWAGYWAGGASFHQGSWQNVGHMSIGSAATVLAAVTLYVNEIETANAGTYYGVASRCRLNPTGNFTTAGFGCEGGVHIGTAQTRIAGASIGVSGYAIVNNGIDARDLNMYGGSFYVDVEDAGVGGGVGAAVAEGLRARTPQVDTGNATSGYGLHILQGTVGAGFITTLTGLYVDVINAGATSWAAYFAGGDSYHAGRWAVGGTTVALAMGHFDQSAVAGAIPVLYLDQADISEEMIEFNTTIGVGNAIEAVGGKTLTVTHFIKITIPGPLIRYIPVGTIA